MQIQHQCCSELLPVFKILIIAKKLNFHEWASLLLACLRDKRLACETFQCQA